MKKSYSHIKKETDEVVKDLYLSLRWPILTKNEAQKLEVILSTSIVQAEEKILFYKKSSDTDIEEAYQERRAILKRIADGLACKFFGFDEHLLRVYAMSDAPGFMAGKSGYLSERKAIQGTYSFSEIKFAIQNDITNILRVGDITLLLPDEIILPIEIKSGKRGRKRLRKQLK